MSFSTMLFNLIIGPLKLVFEFIFALMNRFGSPGISIVALSLCMNFLVLPLYRRADAIQDEERETEKRLAPGVEHIRKTFHGDQQFMTLQTYYRQNHYSQAHALKGLLPLLLEIPFFIAAYQFLSGLNMLKNAAFGPIRDLSSPDGLLVIAGVAINVLPILMTVINLISSEIYMHGAPLKSKIQLYVMALVFLFLLYSSPAGLTMYWTLNNLFSLVKNIVVRTFGGRKKERTWKVPAFLNRKPRPGFFFLAAAFIALLTGALIPSAVIASSPSEFLDSGAILHPYWYIVNSLLLSAGLFVVWLGIYYMLGKDRMKKGMEIAMWILAGIMIVDYMGFHMNFGVLSSTLQFETIPFFTWKQKLVNLAVLAVAAVLLFLVHIHWEQLARGVCLVGVIAVSAMTVINGVQAQPEIQNGITALKSGSDDTVHFSLSKNGKNVVVFMLDRAISSYVPSILKEKPELAASFDGFTWYPNTISHGGFTNFGTPGLFGGYEYTPWEMNQRTDKTLPEKHDEALLVLPTLYSRAGYDVTVIDPPYAGSYAFYPDLSIYDELQNVHAYRAIGAFGTNGSAEGKQRLRMRNFFCYALCETAPWAVYGTLYNVGYYNETNTTMTLQVRESMSKSSGSDADFNANYGVLCNLTEMTQFLEDDTNTLLVMNSDIPHTPQLLQTPDYVPQYFVDNTEYDAAHTSRFTDVPVPLDVTNEDQMSHYHVDMAAFIQIAGWLDALKANGTYDNTRIIFVSDHGRNLGLRKSVLLEDGEDLLLFHALLMVKDFDSHGDFAQDDTFMTNADVPTLATEGLFDQAVNPFTGKVINGRENKADDQMVIASHEWGTDTNNGVRFIRSKWYRVDHEALRPEAWTYAGEE
ncbi:MAG: membrane protein insertase YidC [Clostridiales bacterium]|nr:membrane protein insertase YidC [Clostridiales bacterium]